MNSMRELVIQEVLYRLSQFHNRMVYLSEREFAALFPMQLKAGELIRIVININYPAVQEYIKDFTSKLEEFDDERENVETSERV